MNQEAIKGGEFTRSDSNFHVASNKNICMTSYAGDIFSSNNKAIAHYISADLGIHNELDKQFQNRYGRREELKTQNPFIGRCCVINTNRQTILITKVSNSDVTTYNTIENSLKHLCELCVQMKLTVISIPQESFEVDNLDWTVIKQLLNKVFSKANIKVRVYQNQNKNKFELIQTILKYSEEQLSTCFISEVDILDKKTNEIVNNNHSDTITIKFKNHQLFNSRCIIETKLNDFSIDALIDTGADFCYIREELCNELNLMIENYDCDVVVGNNQKLQVLGRVSVKISISNYEYPITCTVVKTLSHSLVLGWIGFIKESDGIINAKEGLFTLKRSTNHLSSFAFFQNSIHLKPFTENVIIVEVNEQNTTDLLFVKTYEPLFKKTGITMKEKKTITVLNNGNLI